MNKIKKILNNPYYVFGRYLKKNYPKSMSDKYFIRVTWEQCMGFKLDLDNPKTFNEKLQWLKLNNRDTLLVNLVDKKLAKEWVASRVGKGFVIPTLGVYDSVDRINVDELPNQFVLKCNHDCGSVIICRNKSEFDFESAKSKLNAALKNNYYWDSREWPYKKVKRCIIAEEYLGDGLQDYRVYCFGGEPKLIYSYTNESKKDGSKPETSYCDVFDTSWNPMPYHQNALPHGDVLPPEHLNEMINCARMLAEPFPFVRVDFYDTDRPFVGELTFFPGGGFSPFHPSEWDSILGSWVSLPH